MTADELDRFLTPEGREQVDAFLTEAREDDGDFDVTEALNRNLDEACAALAPDASTPGLAAHAMVSAFTVSCLPPDDPDVDLYAVKVEYCGTWEGSELWRIVRGESWILNAGGTWDLLHENHGPDWRTTHRHSLNDALRLAKAAAPNVRGAGGMTPAQLIDWRQAGKDGAA